MAAALSSGRDPKKGGNGLLPLAAPLAISLDRLARRYGRELVLTDVSLTVGEGRVVVLHGPNGAGKTTLLKVLATRLRPSRGRGTVFGFDLVRHAHEVRRRTAMLSVFGGSYPALTAAENLSLAARLYGSTSTSDELATCLAVVGLADSRDKLVRTFSSGMKKRLGLARLRLAGARLWLLDEPYAALDEEGKSSVDELLDDARRKRITIVLASHELERVAPFADAVLQVDHGGISLRSD
ncbi:MAG: heme ABC exporter ATP-binding protein CcmA [Trueperaceae bacterium]